MSSVEVARKKKSSPKLYSLSGLQSKINQLYKVSASETLKAVQSLYEMKLLTYPRTDTPYITENEFSYLKANLFQYQAFFKNFDEMTQLEPRKRYVDSGKVQEHHAIILTKQVPGGDVFEKLSDLQQKIYLLIAKTTLGMFLADYEFDETVVEVAVGNLKFIAKGQVPSVQGWQVLFSEKEDSVILPAVRQGDQVEVVLNIVEKETTPPKYYTEGTLLTAMKTAGKTVDDEEAIEILQEVEGIGTEATRASVIESLKNRQYIEIQKNKIMMTEKGKILCAAVQNQHLLTSAEMTAKWESYLKKIGKNEGTQEQFLANIQKFILHLIENVGRDIEMLDVGAYVAQKAVQAQKDVIGVCPKCNGSVVLKKTFYGCSNYPDCKFTLADNFRKKKLTKGNVADLLAGKETIVKGVKNKEKKTYDVIVKRNNTSGYIEFVSFVFK